LERAGPAILKSDREIRAGEWVQVTADRSFRDGVLIVNDGAEVRGKSPGSTRGLNLNTKLFVGGWDRQRVRLNPGVNVTSSFDGCLSQVSCISKYFVVFLMLLKQISSNNDIIIVVYI
jgi:hypothetical protein